MKAFIVYTFLTIATPILAIVVLVNSESIVLDSMKQQHTTSCPLNCDCVCTDGYPCSCQK
jgi:hypothetical protein